VVLRVVLLDVEDAEDSSTACNCLVGASGKKGAGGAATSAAI